MRPKHARTFARTHESYSGTADACAVKRQKCASRQPPLYNVDCRPAESRLILPRARFPRNPAGEDKDAVPRARMRVIGRDRSRGRAYAHLRAARGINYVMTPVCVPPVCAIRTLRKPRASARSRVSCAEKFQRRLRRNDRGVLAEDIRVEIQRRDVDRAERSIKFDPICVSRAARIDLSPARSLARRSH